MRQLRRTILESGDTSPDSQTVTWSDKMATAREKLSGPRDELVAWLLDEDVEDVRRVIGNTASLTQSVEVPR